MQMYAIAKTDARLAKLVHEHNQKLAELLLDDEQSKIIEAEKRVERKEQEPVRSIELEACRRS